MKARTATAVDCAFLAEMNHGLIHDVWHRSHMTVAELEERMKGWLAGSDYHAVIFERDSQPVAYALYRTEPNGTIYLRQFFVLQQHRRQGIGRAAIDLLLRDVLRANSRITVDVLCRNEIGRKFWASVGFQDFSLTMERILPPSPGSGAA